MKRPPARRHETPLAMVTLASGVPWSGWRKIHTGIGGKFPETRVAGFAASDVGDVRYCPSCRARSHPGRRSPAPLLMAPRPSQTP